jgi:hypothetical protein
MTNGSAKPVGGARSNGDPAGLSTPPAAPNAKADAMVPTAPLAE